MREDNCWASNRSASRSPRTRATSSSISELSCSDEAEAGSISFGSGHTYIRLKAEFVYLAVILDGFSRKVVGWALDRTLAVRLTIGALEQAIERRQPAPGLVHSLGSGIFNYAHAEYIAILEKQHMVPSMSRPANPYDNASCESFMKTLKREEIYANKYDDLENLRANIEEFIEQYYNRQRLHSALAIDPRRFEQKDRMPGRISKRDDGVF